jgi:hypothetical protein
MISAARLNSKHSFRSDMHILAVGQLFPPLELTTRRDMQEGHISYFFRSYTSINIE